MISANDMRRRKCFLSAPAGHNLVVLRRVLASRQLDVFSSDELGLGGNRADQVQSGIAQADFVVGVLPAEGASSSVLYELGLASALARRILLIAPPDSAPAPYFLHHLLTLRITLDNEEAIAFAVDQILSAPPVNASQMVKEFKSHSGLGEGANKLLTASMQALSTNDGAALEDVVCRALKAGGTDLVVNSPYPDKGVDLVVWSDNLDSIVGNPILIEVKSRIRSRAEAVDVTDQISKYAAASNARYGLLLYGEGPEAESDWWSERAPNILVLSVREFLAGLRNSSFPELFLGLRNRRIHGVIN